MTQATASRRILAGLCLVGMAVHATVVPLEMPAGAATAPEVGIGDASIWEGDAKSRSMIFPVTLSEPTATPVTVDYVIAGLDATPGTAKTPGADFNHRNGTTRTLTFLPGRVQKQVVVPVYPDEVAEPTESFTVTLSNVTGGHALGRSVGTGTILDDDVDATTRVAVADASVVEGDVGKRSLRFRVTLSRPADAEVSLDYRLCRARRPAATRAARSRSTPTSATSRASRGPSSSDPPAPG